MNEKINELYNKLDAQDEIIEQQIAIINELKKRNKELEDGFKSATDELCEYATKIDKAIEYIKEYLFEDDNGCGCWWYGFEYYQDAKKELLEILGDKE